MLNKVPKLLVVSLSKKLLKLLKFWPNIVLIKACSQTLGKVCEFILGCKKFYGIGPRSINWCWPAWKLPGHCYIWCIAHLTVNSLNWCWVTIYFLRCCSSTFAQKPGTGCFTLIGGIHRQPISVAYNTDDANTWRTLAVNALPVQGSIAKVVLRLRESYVVELHSRVFDISIHHRFNLIGLCSLSLSENVSTALLSFFDSRLQDQAD